MLQTVKNYVFGSSTFPINTIIGGIGVSVTTKSALATKLGISVNLIRRFEILGSDVHCNISHTYTIQENAFYLDTSITFYYDYGGKCISTGRFAFAQSSIVNAYLTECVVGNAAFSNCSLFTNENLNWEYIYNSTVTIDNDQFRNSKLRKIKGNIKDLRLNMFRSCSELLEIDCPLITIGNYALSMTPKLRYVNLSQVTSISYNSFSGTGLSIISLPNLTNIIGNTAFRDSKVTQVLMPSLEYLSEVAKLDIFNGCTLLSLISMKKLKNIENPSTHPNTYRLLKSGCIIEVHINLKTINAGLPDAGLQYAKDSRGAIVKFYDNDGNYVSTL